MMIPIFCESVFLYRSVESGMRISAVQPCGPISAAVS